MQLAEPQRNAEDRLEELFATVVKGEGIKVRLQPSIYDQTQQAYRAWSGTSWGLSLESREEALEFKETLAVVLKAMGDLGMAAVKQAVEDRY